VPYRVTYEPAPLTADKVVARRVALELVKLIGVLGRPIVVNLGIGIPALAADVIREERLDDFIHLTVESGPWAATRLWTQISERPWDTTPSSPCRSSSSYTKAAP